MTSKLTKKELEALDGLHAYYCSLDYIETNGYGDYDEESKQASDDEQLIKNALGKLLKDLT